MHIYARHGGIHFGRREKARLSTVRVITTSPRSLREGVMAPYSGVFYMEHSLAASSFCTMKVRLSISNSWLSTKRIISGVVI